MTVPPTPTVIEIGLNAAGGAARNGATQAAMSINVAAMAYRASQDHRTTLLPRAALDCQRASPNINRQRATGTIPIAPEHSAAASFNPASMRSR
jgi:hypothetical protein